MTYPSRNRRQESTSIRLDQKPPPQDQFRVHLHKIKSEPTSMKLDQIQPPQGQTGIHLHKNRSESSSTRLVQSPPQQGQIRVYHHYKQICYHCVHHLRPYSASSHNSPNFLTIFSSIAMGRRRRKISSWCHCFLKYRCNMIIPLSPENKLFTIIFTS